MGAVNDSAFERLEHPSHSPNLVQPDCFLQTRKKKPFLMPNFWPYDEVKKRANQIVAPALVTIEF